MVVTDSEECEKWLTTRGKNRCPQVLALSQVNRFGPHIWPNFQSESLEIHYLCYENFVNFWSQIHGKGELRSD